MRRKMLTQKIYGAFFIAMGFMFTILAITGENALDSNIVPAIFLYALGFVLLLSKECWLY